ncbi:MAG: DNA polymerase III subunit gamma/tau [Burkholderiales bacterium]|jgi:DNA polymerase-3 subunit gamma/tau|nr:DNA polymerase III subunit gamma/tau [Burkholderiales bacterium]
MSYQALARQWRPRTFAELVGQSHVVTALQNALTRGRVHHAYLLTGTRGVGKTTLARILAKSLNCEQGVTATPCGQCAACTAIDEGRFVDLLELDAASNTGIDNMREILDNARYAPTAGRYKVYLIDEVHMLSKAAFNSMLKTLEEPPEHVKFVLATTDPQKIPVTVLSRCLQFSLKPLPAEQVKARLAHILEAEKIAFDDGGLMQIARAARGSLRDALSLLDQAIAYGAGSVQETQVRAMLGAVDRDYVYRLVEALAAHDGAALLAEADGLAARGLDAGAVLDELIALFHRIAVTQVVPEAVNGFEDSVQVAALAARFSAEEIQLFYQIALQGRADLALAPDETMGMSMTLLRLLAFTPEAPSSSPATPAPTRREPGAGQTKTAASEKATEKLAPARQETETPPPPIQSASGAGSSAAPQQTPVGFADTPFEKGAMRRQGGGEANPRPSSTDTPFEKGAVRAFPTSSDEWSDWIVGLELKGMAAQLAANTEWRSFADGTLTLALPETQHHLANKANTDKLKKALEEASGLRLRLAFEKTGVADTSLAARQRQAREQAQRDTEEAFRSDAFVQALEKEGGEVRWETVKPAVKTAVKPAVKPDEKLAEQPDEQSASEQAVEVQADISSASRSA